MPTCARPSWSCPYLVGACGSSNSHEDVYLPSIDAARIGKSGRNCLRRRAMCTHFRIFLRISSGSSATSRSRTVVSGTRDHRPRSLRAPLASCAVNSSVSLRPLQPATMPVNTAARSVRIRQITLPFRGSATPPKPSSSNRVASRPTSHRSSREFASLCIGLLAPLRGGTECTMLPMPAGDAERRACQPVRPLGVTAIMREAEPAGDFFHPANLCTDNAQPGVAAK